MSTLSYDERDVLKTILRYHQNHGEEGLLGHLEVYVTWIRDIDQARLNRNAVHQPALPLVLLGLMGIYGKDALS